MSLVTNAMWWHPVVRTPMNVSLFIARRAGARRRACEVTLTLDATCFQVNKSSKFLFPAQRVIGESLLSCSRGHVAKKTVAGEDDQHPFPLHRKRTDRRN